MSRIPGVGWLTALSVLAAGASAPPPWHPQSASAAGTDRSATELGRALARSSGVRGGVGVVLGRQGADLATSMAEASRGLLVHALYADRAALEKARAAMAAKGVYGLVSADLLRGGRLPYTDNLVNLLVADRFPALLRNGLSLSEVLWVLAPFGVAYLGAGASSDVAWTEPLVGRLRELGVEKAEVVDEGGAWVRLKKAWPSAMDEWTHYLHGADGNPVSRDRLVGPPSHVQWIADPKWTKAHETDPSVTSMVSAGGRLFYVVDESPIGLPGKTLPDKWSLVARDGFNGVVLWKRPIRDWGWRSWKPTWYNWKLTPLQLPRRLVAVGDTVYVTLGYNAPLSALDAATGKTIRTYAGTSLTDELVCHDGVLVVACNRSPQRVEAASERGDKRGPKKKLVALRAKTGSVLWQRDGFQGTGNTFHRADPLPEDKGARSGGTILNLAVGSGVVCFLNAGHVVCLDFATGNTRWAKALATKGRHVTAGVLMVRDGVVLASHSRDLAAFSAKTGAKLWSRPQGTLGWYTWKDVFVARDLVWTWSGQMGKREIVGRRKDGRPVAVGGSPLFLYGLDLRTGAVKRKTPVHQMLRTIHHHRCYRNKATERYVITSRRGAEFLSLDGGAHSLNIWLRTTCQLGYTLANGLQYAPPHACACYADIKLAGFYAVAAARAGAKAPGDEATFPLEKGPAYGRAKARGAGGQDPDDWPTFRGDFARTSSSGTSVPAQCVPSRRLRILREATAEWDAGPTAPSGKRAWLCAPPSPPRTEAAPPCQAAAAAPSRRTDSLREGRARTASSRATPRTASGPGATPPADASTVLRRATMAWSCSAAPTAGRTVCGPTTGSSSGGSARPPRSSASGHSGNWSRRGRSTAAFW